MTALVTTIRKEVSLEAKAGRDLAISDMMKMVQKKIGKKTHQIPLMKTPTSRRKRSQKSARPLRKSNWTYLLA